MKLRTRVLTTAALALALTLPMTAPAQATTPKAPVAETEVFVANSFVEVKLRAEGSREVERFGQAVAARYTLTLSDEKHRLRTLHLGYWRAHYVFEQLDGASAKSKAALNEKVHKLSKVSAKEAKAFIKRNAAAYRHSYLKSDVRNTVTNYVTAVALSLDDPQATPIDLKAMTVISTGDYGYDPTITIVPQADPLLFDVVGRDAKDGFTYSFDGDSGRFTASK